MEMFIYYCRLSLHNFKRTPLFFVLMIATLAIGVGVFLANLTILHSMSNDPIPHKSDKIFNVSMNHWPDDSDRNNAPMHILRYSDAMHILQSDIPTHALVHYESEAYVRDPEADNMKRRNAKVRATTGEFFSLTDAPFAFGGSWQQKHAQQIVIGHALNQQLFAGVNSVGQSLEIYNKLYQVVGVLKPWHLKPLFYDAVGSRAFKPTFDIFLPLEQALDNELGTHGNRSSTSKFDSMAKTRQQDVFYLQVFVQLDNQQQKADFSQYLDSYSQSLKDVGLHPQPVNNRLLDVNQWLTFNKVVDQRMVAFALASSLFLAVCIFNASSLLLSRYHSGKFETALRRAIGASKKQVFYQGIVESLLLGIASALVSLLLAYLFLQLSQYLFDRLENIAKLDSQMLLLGIAIALTTTFISTLYPLAAACFRTVSSELK
jgi:putative ABC transport system permease protein